MLIQRLLMSITLLFALSFTATAFAAQGAMSSGEVVKVDAAAGKLTLKHDGVKNLDMPAMSMVFRVRNPAQLAKLKPGDKVHFSAEKVNGEYTVTAVEPAR